MAIIFGFTFGTDLAAMSVWDELGYIEVYYCFICSTESSHPSVFWELW
jgi:hypothetical protein